MGKGNNAMQISTWTTGAGIAIGTDIDIGGIIMGSAATTVTLKVGATTILSVSGASVPIAQGLATTGAITGTSSGGNFGVLYRPRVS